jgi:hypothetical protein
MFRVVSMASLAVLSLTGCTSLQGRPSPVISMRQSVELAAKYPLDQAIEAFYSTDAAKRNGLTPAQYRNNVISVYMSGIDSRYYNFVLGLSSQNKGSNLTLGTVALGLSSGAAIAGERVANILSTGAAFATGTQAQVNQRLYYEKTLPAIIAGMNTNRDQQKQLILLNMRKSDVDYPIEAAFAQLADFQNAASIDAGIEQVTASAAAAATEQRTAVNAAALGN